MNYCCKILFVIVTFFNLKSAISQPITSPGGIGDSTTNVLWLRADSSVTESGNVSTWGDISGNDINFTVDAGTVPFVASSGLNSQPAVSFGAGELIASDNDILDNTAEMTIFIAMRPDDASGAEGVLCKRVGNADEQAYVIFQNGANFIARMAESSSLQVTAATAIAASTNEIYTIKYDGSNGTETEVFTGGTSAATGNGQPSTLANNASNLIIGTFNSGDTRRFDGDIAEIIMYRDALNAAERLIIENYLSDKYAITVGTDVFTSVSYKDVVIGIGRSGADTHYNTDNNAGLILSASSLSDGEYAMAAYDASANMGSTIADLGAIAATNRWERDYFIDVTGSSSNTISLRFDFNQGITGGLSSSNPSNYVLLYRSGTTGDYAIVSSSATTFGTDVNFDVALNSISDGYFTLGTTNNTTSPIIGETVTPTTWYTVEGGGDWDDPTTWTTDGATIPLYVNPGALLPGPSDEVIISSNDIVTISDVANNQRSIDGGNDDQSINISAITIDGDLKVTNSSGHNFGNVEGNGRVFIEGYDDDSNPVTEDVENFPAYTLNTFFDAEDGGTLVIEGDGMALDKAEAYGKLTIDLASSSDTVFLQNDVSTNGTFTVTQGVFQFGDNTDAVQHNLTIDGDVVVSSMGKMTVGTGDPQGANTGYGNYHKYFHVFTVHGDFTNNGKVSFTNQIVPNYTTRTSTGAVSLVFTGAQNNTLTCNDTTDIYYLVVNKGIDQTYTLTINSSSISHFALFGDNDETWNNSDSENPETRKALWIASGTLNLIGTMHIPSLTESESGGGLFNIGAKARFRVNSSNVEVEVTAHTVDNAPWSASDFTGLSHGTPDNISNSTGTLSGLYLFGKLQVDNGMFRLPQSSGIIFRDDSDESTIEINGGTIETTQVRLSTGSSASKTYYTQTGGEFYVKDVTYTGGTYAAFDLSGSNTAFTMTGGTMYIEDNTDDIPSALAIGSDESSTEVTGGLIVINTDDPLSSIRSDVPLPSLQITQNDTVLLDTSLVLIDDLIIDTLSLLDHDGFAVTIGGDLIIDGEYGESDAGAYGGIGQLDENTTTFNGTSNQLLDLQNRHTDGTNHWTSFYNLVIDKPTGSRLNIGYPDDRDLGSGTSAANQLLHVENDLTVESGTFNFHPLTITFSSINNSNLIVKDSLGIYEPGITASNSWINSSGIDTIRTDGSAYISVYQQNNSNLITVVDGDFEVDRWIYQNGRMNLGSSNLKIENNELSFIGSRADYNGCNGCYSVEDMLILDGNASDGGLSLYVDASTADGTVFTFPLGIGIDNALTANTKYTPVELTLSGVVDDGYIQVNLFNDTLQTIDLATSSGVLDFAHRVRFEGFSTKPTIDQAVFHFSQQDTSLASTDVGTWVPGKVLDLVPFTRSYEDDNIPENETASIVYQVSGGADLGTNWSEASITFDGPTDAGYTLDSAYFLAGATDRFVGSPEIYYNQQNTNVTWGTAAGWFTDAARSMAAPDFPQAGDIVVMSGNNFSDAVTVSGKHEAAEILFERTGTYTGIESMSRLRLGSTDTLTVGKISGVGDIYTQMNLTNRASITADLGEFAANDTSVYLLYMTQDGSYTITESEFFTELPTLRIYGQLATLGNREMTFNYDFNAKNLLVDGHASLLIGGNYMIGGTTDLGFTSYGRIQFPNGSTAYTFTTTDIETANDKNTSDENLQAIEVVAGNSNDIDHRLIVKGNIDLDFFDTENVGTDMVNIDLYTSESENNVILELQGSGAHSFTNNFGVAQSNIELYRIVVNKGTDTTSTFTFNDDFSLQTTSDGGLNMQNGKLILADGSINLTLNSSGSDFEIPGSAGIDLQGGAGIAIPNANLKLDGLLKVSDAASSLDMTGGENNLIYGTTGSAKIDVSAGELLVGGQLRRVSTNVSGVLDYTQTGGTVKVGMNGASVDTRGVFEIVNNPGSSFTLSGGSLVIARDNGASPTAAALFLDPPSFSIAAGNTINIGDPSVVPSNPITINSSIAIPNLFVEDNVAVEAKILIQPLAISNDLNIGDATADANTASLNANGLDLTVSGNINNYGTYTANGNTLIMNGGSTQSILGSGTESIYNFTYNGSSILDLSKGITVTNDLVHSSGTIRTNTFGLEVHGDAQVDATIQSTSGFGLNFSGSGDQALSRSAVGSSDIGILTISNGEEVSISDLTLVTFNITDTVKLEGGVLDIGNNLLVMDEDAVFSTSSAFTVNNMVQTNSSFIDNGVRKLLPQSTTLSNYLIPVGEQTYTPATLNLTNTGSTSNGYITIRPANEAHPSVGEEIVPITSADSILLYYWVVRSENVSGLAGEFTFQYDQSDVPTDVSTDTSTWIPVRLLSTSLAWDKAYSTDQFDGQNRQLTLDLLSSSSSDIEGEYTAGQTDAIGDMIPSDTTDGSGGGNYSDLATWAGGSIPDNGASIVVRNGDVLTMDINNRRFLRTTIESGGILNMGSSTGQSIGAVSGTGTIQISSASFPNGDYTDFFTCTGGGIDYQGTSADYTILSSVPEIRNVTVSGTGNRGLPSNTAIICEDFIVNGPTILGSDNNDVSVGDDFVLTTGGVTMGLNSVWDVTSNFDIDAGTFASSVGGVVNVGGNANFDGGTYDASSSTFNLSGNLGRTSGTFMADNSTLVFEGSVAQTISGDFTASNSSKLYNVTINKSANSVTVSTDVEVANVLTMTDGYFITSGTTNVLKVLEGGTTSGGSDDSFVNGPLYKDLSAAGDTEFIYPIGKAGFYAPAGVSTIVGDGEWYAEYIDITNIDLDNDLGPSGAVTERGSWDITGPAGSAIVSLSYTGFGVSTNPADLSELRVVKWNGVSTEWEEQGSGVTVDFANSIITADASSTFSTQKYTIGTVSEDNPLPVELIDFYVTSEERQVNVFWSTASEKDNDYFLVLRSFDGEYFESIGRVAGNGTTTQSIDYEFIDNDPHFGLNYYKLQQFDFDGAYEFSPVVITDRKSHVQELDIVVYPNPTNYQNINVRINGLILNSKVSLSMISQFGEEIYHKEVEPSDYPDMAVDVPRYIPSGLYFLILKQDGFAKTSKVIIK